MKILRVSVLIWGLIGLHLINISFAGPKASQQSKMKTQKDFQELSQIPQRISMMKNDPNWDWTENRKYILYHGAGQHPTRLPYYETFGPAAIDFNSDFNGNRDIYPRDGWVCIFRDFGSPDRSVPYPFFILYNRYKGLLRLFYFNPRFEGFNYGIVTLSRQAIGMQEGKSFALFTFTQSDHIFLDDYDPDTKPVFFGKLVNGVWNYADFLVVGYEPNLPDDAKFVFDIMGISEQNIELAGTGTASIDGILDNPPSGDGANVGINSLSDIMDLGQKAWKSYKNAGNMVNEIAKKFDSKTSFTKLTATVSFLSGIVGAVSAAATVVDFFIGDDNNDQSSQSIKFKGNMNMDLDLQGTIKKSTPEPAILVRVPGANHLGSDDLPFYDQPLGIFNLNTVPKLMLTDLCKRQTEEATFTLSENIRLTINPHISQNIDKIEAALFDPMGILVRNSISGRDYFRIDVPFTFPNQIQFDFNNCWKCSELSMYEIAIRITVKPEVTSDPITLIKTSPTREIFNLAAQCFLVHHQDLQFIDLGDFFPPTLIDP